MTAHILTTRDHLIFHRSVRINDMQTVPFFVGAKPPTYTFVFRGAEPLNNFFSKFVKSWMQYDGEIPLPLPPPLPPPLSFDQIWMIDAHSAESKEKSIFRFLFFELLLIVFIIHVRHFGNFRCHMTFSSKVAKFTEKMRNKLKWMQNQVSDLCDFYLMSYGRFYTQNSSKNWLILSKKTTISQKLSIRKLIFHSFQHILHLLWKYKPLLNFFLSKIILSIWLKKSIYKINHIS